MRERAPILAAFGCLGQRAANRLLAPMPRHEWGGAYECLGCLPSINDHSVPGAVIQPSSIQRCSSLFIGSANGTLLADSAEISAVREVKQAVLPQCHPFGQQRPLLQHF